MENLLKVFDLAKPDDIEKAERAWTTYSTLTGRISEQFGFSPEIGAAVFAALSPNNDYYGNLRDTRRVLEGVRNGKTPDQVKVSTYNNNKRKAWAIALGAPPLDLIVFPKTRSFFLNIRDPLDPVPVTVDGHIYNAWQGKRIPLVSAAARFKPALYETIAEDVREIGRKKGLIPNIVQGYIWYAWRTFHNIRSTAQTELWSIEARHAGYDIPWFQTI